MLDGILNAVGRVFGVVDEIHTSDEEKMALKVPLLAIQADVAKALIDAERAQMEAQARVIEAEAKSEHALTSMWRPITMMVFVALIVVAQFGGPPVPDQMWPLLNLGLGGYVVGRTFEKTLPAVVDAFKAREK
jgi:hypothetical protein